MQSVMEVVVVVVDVVVVVVIVLVAYSSVNGYSNGTCIYCCSNTFKSIRGSSEGDGESIVVVVVMHKTL